MSIATHFNDPMRVIKFTANAEGKIRCARRPQQKVLFTLRSEVFGGLEVVLLDWLSAIDHFRCRAVVATSNEAQAKKLTENSLPVEGLPLVVRCLRPQDGGVRLFWCRIREWHAFLSSVGPDIIIFPEGAPPPDYDWQLQLPDSLPAGGTVSFTKDWIRFTGNYRRNLARKSHTRYAPLGQGRLVIRRHLRGISFDPLWRANAMVW